MKKMKSSYRLQIIKEVAQRHRLLESNDPMATHISHLLNNHATPEKEQPMFSGSHYDEHAGGWVSNIWDKNKQLYQVEKKAFGTGIKGGSTVHFVVNDVMGQRMNYIELDSYSRKWIFTHASMPVDEQDLAQIKPLTQARSAQIWREFISTQSADADHFEQGDWAFDKKIWSEPKDWQGAWDEDENILPVGLLDTIQWEDNTTVYFCYEKYNIIETKWGTFKRNWKNFLFFDDGPLLLGRKQEKVLWFKSNGTYLVGNRPK